MSISVLPQLLEVDSALSAQASTLEAQLIALQEKRNGIQTVLAMFESGDVPAADIAAIAKTSAKTSAKSTPKKTAAKAKSTAAETKSAKAARTTTKAKATKAAAKTKVEKATKEKTTKVKASRGRPAKAKSAASEKTTATTKRSGRTANWQKYVQDSYSKAPLPDVIVGVLQAQPNNIFKIADVMSAVFKEDMPKTHFLKARNRVSNILSAGARDGDWFRGRGGTYSVSEKAIKSVG